MYYVSTREKGCTKVLASTAIANGIAPDGGLYVPTEFPSIGDFAGKSYQEILLKVLSLYLTDFSDKELAEYIENAYKDALPVCLNCDYLELFHGKTQSFKDMALQLFPYLLSAALRKCENKRENCDTVTQTQKSCSDTHTQPCDLTYDPKQAVILTATSGDTGPAVLSGIAGVEGLHAIVIYPNGGTSEVQHLQMATQIGANVNVFAINGNFDDAQRAVKEIFADQDFRNQFEDKYLFTSANSINPGRILPQVAHFFYGYSELVRQGRIANGDKINYCVPTGNFGNLLSAYYAKKMGLPVHKLICATNENRVLDEFFKTGILRDDFEFKLTNAPAMDILVPSNLERFMGQPLDDFESGFATEEQVLQTIRSVYADSSYIIDPHTAVAKHVYDEYKLRTGDETLTIIVSTASPYKFAETITCALGKNVKNVMDNPPNDIAKLYEKPILHSKVINVEQLRDEIKEILL